jgi:hypothetical protein
MAVRSVSGLGLEEIDEQLTLRTIGRRLFRRPIKLALAARRSRARVGVG